MTMTHWKGESSRIVTPVSIPACKAIPQQMIYHVFFTFQTLRSRAFFILSCLIRLFYMMPCEVICVSSKQFTMKLSMSDFLGVGFTKLKYLGKDVVWYHWCEVDSRTLTWSSMTECILMSLLHEKKARHYGMSELKLSGCSRHELMISTWGIYSPSNL